MLDIEFLARLWSLLLGSSPLYEFGSDYRCRRFAVMATAFHHIDLPEPARSVTLEARVGAATWLIDLDHHALEVLSDGDIVLGPASVARIMENVKAKAVAMRWFGGGRIAVGADELTLPAPGPIRMDDGSERMPTPWFQLVDVRGRSRAARKLQSVA